LSANWYLQRPELKPPRWDINVYDEEKVTPGYWFVGIKPSLEKTIGTGQGWFGPHIYDGNGELVWSGADQFDTSNVMDFRMSTVRGEWCLTVLDRDRQIGVVLDNHYEMVDTFEIDPDQDNVNGHELNFVNDGKSALILQNFKADAPKDEAEQVGYYDEEKGCEANYMAFKEYDAEDQYKPIFEWNALGKIRLNESTETDSDIYDRCNTWDFM
jgi:hypothetical protein